MQNYVEIPIANHVYKLDRKYKTIARKKRFSKEEVENLRQINSESNYWRDKSLGVIGSLDERFFGLCSSSELDGIDLIFEKRMNKKGNEFYCLTESNKKVIFSR